MFSRKTWGVLLPLLLSSVVLVVVLWLGPQPPVKWGIVVGVTLALAQSFLSTGALYLTWNKPFFYWVWGAGMLFRLLVLSATAFIVYAYTGLNLVATLVTMVTATTLFLVIEAAAIFK